MKKINLLIRVNYRAVCISLLLLLFFLPFVCRAMPPGTLLYRTSNDGKMFGYSNNPLFVASKGIVNEINSGHAAIYVGKIDGEDYIVEALGGGIVKTPAKYFVNTSLGEKFLGAKIPKGLNSIQQAKVVALAKNIAEKNLGYDYDFKKQKGPGDGEWTCVGLTEKIYESANISNPNNFKALEYDPNYYAFDITPDGYDNTNVKNSYGDCFAESVEFSKIGRRKDLLIPAPELIGYDAGIEHEGDRYIFLPYTQFVQPSLDDVKVDISVSESFNDKDFRANAPSTMIALRWSLINNPLSSLKTIANKVKEVAISISDKIFKKNETAIVLDDSVKEPVISNTKATSTSKTTTAAKKTTTSKSSSAKETVTKATADKSQSVSVKKASPSSTKAGTSVKAVTTPKTISSSTKSSVAKDTTVKASSTQTSTANMSITQNTTPLKTISHLVSAQASVIVKSTSSNIVNIATTQTNTSTTTNSNNNSNSNSTTASTSNATSTESTVDDWPKIAFIKRIYSTGDNDWVELFNPTDHDFDLKTAEYRLAKTKTSVSPSLLMRIGNADDGSYPGGTIIKAHDSYMIVRDDASSYYKDRADAISTRDEFTWPGNGYTLYLGNGAISSDEDPNIVDAVGFGNEATYFLGAGPAPEIIDNYILTKTASTSNNAQDFSLLLSDEPGLVATSSDNNIGDEENSDTPDWEAYLSPTPINSEGLTDLWHFDECYGSNIKWGVGKWGCALELTEFGSSLVENLGPNYDLDNISISFYYKKNYNSRIIFGMANSFNEKIELLIEPGLVQVDGLPNSKWRYPQDYMVDYSWHQAVLVVNRENQYWAVYIDGKEKIKESFVAALPNMENFKIWSNQGKTLIDEFAIWPRVLSPAEIENNYQADSPFSPVASRESQKAPVLKHFWHFDEGHGSTSLDNIGGLSLDIPNGVWQSSGRLNTAITSLAGKSISVDLANSVKGKDYSLSLWWKNSVYPNNGRSYISLRNENKNLFGFTADYFRNSYWFNSNYGIFHEGIGALVPYDDQWHHLALTYDSYRYSLNFYVDGEEKASTSLIWLQNGNEPNLLEINSESDYTDIDELGIWQGALSNKQIKTLFEDTPEFH